MSIIRLLRFATIAIVTSVLTLAGTVHADRATLDGIWSYDSIYAHPTSTELLMSGYIVIDDLNVTTHVLHNGWRECQHTTLSEFIDNSYTQLKLAATIVDLEVVDHMKSGDISLLTTFKSGTRFTDVYLTPAEDLDIVAMMEGLPLCTDI